MKKTFKVLGLFTLVAFIGVSLPSCGKITELLPPIETQIAEVEISLPMVTNIDVKAETSTTMKLNIDSLVKLASGNQYSISKVSSISVKEVKLVLHETNEGNNLANFENAEVRLSSYSITNPTVIASTSSIADTYANTLTLEGDASKNVKQYLTDPSISFSLLAKARRVTEKELHGTIYMTVLIKL